MSETCDQKDAFENLELCKGDYLLNNDRGPVPY